MSKTKSINRHPTIYPKTYDAIRSGYSLQIIFSNNTKSYSIEMNTGIRGMNCHCKVRVDSDGWVYII